jgi:hypothetical protein
MCSLHAEDGEVFVSVGAVEVVRVNVCRGYLLTKEG